MGEIADQVIDGSCCELCLTPFSDPGNALAPYSHGYPVVCEMCYSQLTPQDKKHHQKAHAPTLGH